MQFDLTNLVLVPCGGCLLSELEVLGSLEAQLLLRLTFLALQPQHDLTGGLGLLVEDGLGLSAVPHLLAVVPALALREVGRLSRLVLGHLVYLVLLALAARAVGAALLRDVHHGWICIDGVNEFGGEAHDTKERKQGEPLNPVVPRSLP